MLLAAMHWALPHKGLCSKDVVAQVLAIKPVPTRQEYRIHDDLVADHVSGPLWHVCFRAHLVYFLAVLLSKLLCNLTLVSIVQKHMRLVARLTLPHQRHAWHFWSVFEVWWKNPFIDTFRPK
jgi:hypothetical protein